MFLWELYKLFVQTVCANCLCKLWSEITVWSMQFSKYSPRKKKILKKLKVENFLPNYSKHELNFSKKSKFKKENSRKEKYFKYCKNLVWVFNENFIYIRVYIKQLLQVLPPTPLGRKRLSTLIIRGIPARWKHRPSGLGVWVTHGNRFFFYHV